MTDDIPLVSIVIPAHNSSPTIRATLESAIRQTYKNKEIIIVDDGSKDDTSQIVSHLIARNRDVPIKIVSKKKNGGVSDARNVGIDTTNPNCRFVALLDSDDVWQPEKIERQIQEVLRRPEQERDHIICTSNLQIHTIDIRDNRRITKTERQIYYPSDLERKLMGTYPSTWLISRALFNEDKVGKFDTKLTVMEDHDWHLRAVKWGAITICPQQPEGERPLTTYFANPKATYGGVRKMKEGIFAFIKKHEEWLKKEAPYEFAGFLQNIRITAIYREVNPSVARAVVRHVDATLERIPIRYRSPEGMPERGMINYAGGKPEDIRNG